LTRVFDDGQVPSKSQHALLNRALLFWTENNGSTQAIYSWWYSTKRSCQMVYVAHYMNSSFYGIF